MGRSRQTEVPYALAARILFQADRTCCVCRTAGKSVQIHHIDGNHENHEPRNLAVLCLECHGLTLMKGGFHRKLDPDQVTLYRDDWDLFVAKRRAKNDVVHDLSEEDRRESLSRLATTLEILRERRQYISLAIRYSALGNTELRDKYVERALASHPLPADETVIFLRSMQGRRDLIPKQVIEREVQRRQAHGDWSQLARIYAEVGDFRNAVIGYCKSIINSLDHASIFPAAYYLKELCESGLVLRLFEESYNLFKEKDDLWWQVRALQELGWQAELEALLVAHRAEIEKSGHLLLLLALYRATGETEKLHEVEKKIAEQETFGRARQK